MLPNIDPKQVLFTVTGTIQSGEQLGRTIGFPTANFDRLPGPKATQGVYAGWVELPGHPQPWLGLAHFGPRPVLGQTAIVFEVYIVDFSDELYGQTVTFSAGKHLRGPESFAFPSLSALTTQLKKDQTAGVAWWKSLRPATA